MARYYSSDTRSVFGADGSVKMDMLTKEMGTNIFEDKRYSNVDEMKKKAITKVRDYDEFKSFVACAHDMLTPVTSKEFQELTKGREGWAHTAATRATTSKKGKEEEEPKMKQKNKRSLAADIASVPVTPGDFERTWRRCREKEKQREKSKGASTAASSLRVDYLSAHDAKDFANVWRRDLDATLSCEVLALVTRLESSRALHLLQAVALAPRFELNLMFLDTATREAVENLLNTAPEDGALSPDALVELKRRYGIKSA